MGSAADRTLTALAAACLLGLALTGCSGDTAGKPDPVLLLCVDGLEPRLVQRWMAEGRLPNLSRLAREGWMGSLETLFPTWSPVIWTTIATGQGLREHGVVGFLEPTSSLPYTSNSRRVPALWNLVGAGGRTVDTIGYWVTWPAEPINGRLVASYAAQAQAQVIWKPGLWRELPRQTYPEDLLETIQPLITFSDDAAAIDRPLAELTGGARPADGREEKMLIDLAWTLMGDRSFASIAESFLDQEPADLTIVYLSLPDVAGHRFWRYLFPEEMEYEVPAADVERFGGVIQRCYEETDRQLGRLLAQVSASTNIVLISDHGMHKDLETLTDPNALTSGHHQSAPSGLFAALGPAFEAKGAQFSPDNPRGLVGDVRGVAPLVLRLLDLEIPEHWPFGGAGNPLEETLSARFSRAHRRRFEPSPDAAWLLAHPPSLPIDPGAGLNQGFIDAMVDLGYLTRDGKPRSLSPEGDPEGR